MHFKAFFPAYLCVVFVFMYMYNATCSVPLKPSGEQLKRTLECLSVWSTTGCFGHRSSQCWNFFLSKAHPCFLRILKIICSVFNMKINRSSTIIMEFSVFLCVLFCRLKWVGKSPTQKHHCLGRFFNMNRAFSRKKGKKFSLYFMET